VSKVSLRNPAAVPPTRLPPAFVGVMDSGVGGLSVLREIHRLLPNVPTVYFADQAHLPYGPRPAAEIHQYVEAIVQFFIQQGARVIVLACHTASATSLYQLRKDYPDMPFVGIEPAVKPAAEATQTGVIGVLSTEITAKGTLYQSVVNRFARHVQVITQPAPRLVTLVEDGDLISPYALDVVRDHVQPMNDANADHLVLACTHFPFLESAFRACTDAVLIEPAPAVARQTARLLEDTTPIPGGDNIYLTSGDPLTFSAMIEVLTGMKVQAVQVLL
jgi:glutamate racemase